MAKYVVIALSVGGLGNKIHYSDDIVDSSAFEDGHADQLVKEGFLKPYEPGEKPMGVGTGPDETGGQKEAPAGDPPPGEDQKPETPAPPADLGKELAEKAKSGKTTPKK